MRSLFMRTIHADNENSDQIEHAQADLSLCLVYISKGTFSNAAAHFIYVQ